MIYANILDKKVTFIPKLLPYYGIIFPNYCHIMGFQIVFHSIFITNQPVYHHNSAQNTTITNKLFCCNNYIDRRFWKLYKVQLLIGFLSHFLTKSAIGLLLFRFLARQRVETTLLLFQYLF